MFLGVFCRIPSKQASDFALGRTMGLALFLAVCVMPDARGESVPTASKHTIGATATLTEVSTGIPFSARIDTGAKTCSLHAEKIEIKDRAPGRLANIGKTIRFRLDNGKGQSKWVETTIADAVRVKSSALKDGEYDQRYKVRLTFDWQGFRKEVLVTLNDRTTMEFPLLVGRNYLRGDFLVDVDKKDE